MRTRLAYSGIALGLLFAGSVRAECRDDCSDPGTGWVSANLDYIPSECFEMAGFVPDGDAECLDCNGVTDETDLCSGYDCFVREEVKPTCMQADTVADFVYREYWCPKYVCSTGGASCYVRGCFDMPAAARCLVRGDQVSEERGRPTCGTGACQAYAQCNGDGILEPDAPCDEKPPGNEVCETGIDENCDGVTDEEKQCVIDEDCCNGSDDDNDEGRDDDGCAAAQCGRFCGNEDGEPVNLYSRQAYVGPVIDVSLPVGIPGVRNLEFARVWDSQLARYHWEDDYSGDSLSQTPLYRPLGAGFRHSFDDYLTFVPLGGRNNPRSVTWHRPTGAVRFGSINADGQFLSEPGTNHSMVVTAFTSDTNEPFEWEITADGGDRYRFRRATLTGEDIALLDSVRPQGAQYGYYTIQRLGSDCSGRVLNYYSGAPYVNCVLVGLPKRVSFALVRPGLPRVEIASLDFYYWLVPPSPGAAKKTEFLLRQLSSGTAIDAGAGDVPMVRYTWDIPGGTENIGGAEYGRLLGVQDAYGCSNNADPYAPGCLPKWSMEWSHMTGVEPQITTVRTAVVGDDGVPFMTKAEEFSWGACPDCPYTSGIVSHESLGVSLSTPDAVGYAPSMRWTRNGVTDYTEFDDNGNAVKCGSGRCGATDFTGEYQYARFPLYTLGKARSKNDDGTFTLRQFNDFGQVVVEAVVSPDTSTSEPSWLVTWTGTSTEGALVEIAAGTPLSVRRYYYHDNGRLQATAEHATFGQALNVVHFPSHGDSTTGWFYEGSVAQRSVVETRSTLLSGSYVFRVSVHDSDSDLDGILNEAEDFLTAATHTAWDAAPSGPSRESSTWTERDEFARPTVVERRSGASVLSRTEYRYHDVDDPDPRARGRLQEVIEYTDLPFGIWRTAWRACATTSTTPPYDYDGRLTCFEEPQRPYPLVTTDTSTVLSDVRYRERVRSVNGQVLLSTFSKELGSGVVIEAGTVGGNYSTYSWTPDAPATWATLPSMAKNYLSDGSVFSSLTQSYNSYGFPARTRAWAGPPSSFGIGEARRMDRIYASSGTFAGMPWPVRIAEGFGLASSYSDYAYTSSGTVSAVLEGDGDEVDYVYGNEGSRGAIGRLIRIDRDGVPVQDFSYDDDGRLQAVWARTGASGSPVQAEYEYDSMGRVVLERMRASGREVSYEYDVLGRLSRKLVRSIVSNGVVSNLQYAYDDADRLLAVCDMSDSLSCPREEGALRPGEVVYAYDTKGVFHFPAAGLTDNHQSGNLAYYEDEAGATFFEYDGIGRVVAVARHEAQLQDFHESNLVWVRYVYGPSGEVTDIEYPSGLQVRYVYVDDKERPLEVEYRTDNSFPFQPLIKSIRYDAGDGGPRQWEWIGASARIGRQATRDPVGRISSVVTHQGSTNLTDVSYSYDDDGDVLSETADEPDNWLMSSAGSVSVPYTTHAFRDVLASYRGWSGVTRTYTFDTGGRRRYEAMNSTSYLYGYSGESWTSVYEDRLHYRNRGGTNNSDIVLRWAVDSDGNGSLDFDMGGELTMFDLRWDGTYEVKLEHGPHGNVVGANTLHQGLWSYQYDGEMRRVRKEAAGHWTRFRYGLAGRVLEETRAGSLAATEETDELIYLGDLPIAVVHEGTGPTGTYPKEVMFLETDRMGVVRKIRDDSGALLARLLMTPSGKGSLIIPSLPDEAVPNLRQRHIGQYHDPETGLIENRYRSMIPDLGIYTSPDPLHWLSSARSVGPQAYSYASARPLLYLDPDGRKIVPTSDCAGNYDAIITNMEKSADNLLSGCKTCDIGPGIRRRLHDVITSPKVYYLSCGAMTSVGKPTGCGRWEPEVPDVVWLPPDLPGPPAIPGGLGGGSTDSAGNEWTYESLRQGRCPDGRSASLVHELLHMSTGARHDLGNLTLEKQFNAVEQCISGRGSFPR